MGISFVMFVIDVIEENKLLCCAHVTTKSAWLFVVMVIQLMVAENSSKSAMLVSMSMKKWFYSTHF